MSRGTELKILVALLVALAAVLYWNLRPGSVGGTDAPEAVSVQPLRVPDPALHLDLLARIREMEYGGTHRNIFSSTPPPPPPSKAAELRKAQMMKAASGPPVPPPLQVPLTFYGMAVDSKTGKKLAFFTSGDHVYIAEQGETLLGQFRLMEIGTNTVQFLEVSTGRTAVLTMSPPVTP
ncbi:MAG: hypothetical protein KGL59_07790 [Acidobacteriota bacterium]|nr:hypothetical protein [Acidobacteriota bacterium]